VLFCVLNTDVDGLSHQHDGSLVTDEDEFGGVSRDQFREAQMWPRLNLMQVKPTAVSLPPALCRDCFFFSSATRSDSKCCTEALHIARHDDLSPANVSGSFRSILHAFRLCFSMSLYLFCCPLRDHVPYSS